MVEEKGMNISVGYLYSSIELLALFNNENPMEFSSKSRREIFVVSNLGYLLDLCVNCGWLDNKARYFSITDRGRAINSLNTIEGKLRQQLWDLVIQTKPPWSKAIVYGRHEFKTYASSEVVQCFRESNLLGDFPDERVILWWDSLSNHIRGLKNKDMMEIGRRGERLTLEFEFIRTGVRPKWQAIEINGAGYDVLSIVSSKDYSPLQIEVKSSEKSLDYSTFILTRNEWNQAISSRYYHFHLWSLCGSNSLAVLNVKDISSCIPSDKMPGVWQTVEIPMKPFVNKFKQCLV